MEALRQAARRAEQDSGERAAVLRWALQGALLMVLLALLAGAAWTVWNPQSFPLRSVRLITPLEHVSPEEIRSAIAPYAAAGFVRVDMAGMRERLEALPWIYQASLRRIWPDVIEVEVVEQRPVARWERGGLVNEHGEIFVPVEETDQQQLPLFAGPDGAGRSMVEHHKALSEMAATIGQQPRRIELNERRAWSIELDNGLQLSLGRSDTYLRMRRFISSYAQTIAPRVAEIERIDLRYTNGYAIRWRAGHPPSA